MKTLDEAKITMQALARTANALSADNENLAQRLSPLVEDAELMEAAAGGIIDSFADAAASLVRLTKSLETLSTAIGSRVARISAQSSAPALLN